MKLIGFIGFQRVGKTTAANHLIEQYGFVRHNFKDALVAEIKERFPELLTEIASKEYTQHFGGQKDALFINKPPLMRALLQNYGTNVRRADNPNYWVNRWLYWAEDNYSKKIVADDVRFLNEAKAIKDLDGTLIRLTRPDITTGGTHQSETEHLSIVADHVIECLPGEHDALYAKLDAIMQR